MVLQIQSEKQEPNSRTEFQNRNQVIQILEFSSPIPRTCRNLIQILYESFYYCQEHIQNKMLVGKSQYFQVNIHGVNHKAIHRQ